MEIRFQSEILRSLRTLTERLQTTEQTQEVRLPESMPDIGSVLGVWGKPMIRGKEWRSGAMSVNGGIMAWILYAPEDGTEPRCVETWIPFQLKWDIPETQKDGYILSVPAIKAMDARSTSARKLMVRANIAAWGRALVNDETPVYTPEEIDEDVHLLTSEYPVCIPCESGEKMVVIEESFNLSDIHPVPEVILRYDFSSAITEQRVMSSRLVFRGKGNVHFMYLSGGKVFSADLEVPYSQYTDLDKEYGTGATAQVIPVITNMEIEMTEGKLAFKCELAAQYIIHNRAMLHLAEDAYSNHREVTLHRNQAELPRVLDRRQEALRFTHAFDVPNGNIADADCQYELPQRMIHGNEMGLTFGAQLQLLYYDENGILHSCVNRGSQELAIQADDAVTLSGILSCDSAIQATFAGGQVEIGQAISLDIIAETNKPMEMVCALELGEQKEENATLPSLILQRFYGNRLWEIAKENGSDVEAIRIANDLKDLPEQGRILLIPVS